MANLVDIGFELRTASDGFEIGSNNGGTIDNTLGRSGTSSYRVTPTAALKNFQHTNSSPGATGNVYLRACIYIRALPTGTVTIINMKAAGQCAVKLTAAGKLQLFDLQAAVQIGSDSAALSINTWYVVELRWSTGTYEARIDGAATFASGAPTTPGTSVTDIQIGTTVTDATLDMNFDDVSMNDDSGASETSWVGTGFLDCLRPNAAGDVNTFATQTGGTAGAANNFSRLNESPPDDATTFNGSSTLNEEDLVNLTNTVAGASDTIQSVSVGFRFRNSTADATAAIKVELEKAPSGTILQSAAIVPNSTTFRSNQTGTTVKRAPIITYADPDGAAWTQTTLNSLQAGYKLTTAPGTAGRRIDVTSLWVYVRYTPAVVTTSAPPLLPMLGVG